MRYLRSKKSSRFLSFITILSILGVCLGVTAMIVVVSVMDGFEGELRKRLMTSELHILISPTKTLPGMANGMISTRSEAMEKISSLRESSPEVTQVRPILATEAIMRTGGRITGVVLKGVDPNHLKSIRRSLSETAQEKMLSRRQGSENVRLPSVFVGQEMAFEMNVIPGDEVTLVSPVETQGPLESIPRFQRFVVEGIYHTGVTEQELHVVFAADSTVRSFLRRADVISYWELMVKRFDDAPQIAASLRDRLPGFRVQDWMQLNGRLFETLKLERVAMFISLALIVVVASLNIVSTLMLMVIEKKREIAILKAMGARDSQVAAIFLGEGLFIGAIGISIGLVLALGICLFLRFTNVIALPEIYYDRTLPVTFDAVYYLGVGAAAFVIVLFAAVQPSRRAAQLDPLVGIREN
jgi:lipoprotein-releasing system permease protein